MKAAGLVSAALFCAAGWIFLTRAIVLVASGHAFAEIAYASVCLIAAGVVFWLRHTPAGRELSMINFEADWMGTVVAAVALLGFSTAGFAMLSTVLYEHGVGALGGTAIPDRALGGVAYAYYVWHLADVVPLLEVPKNLNWTLTHPFTDVVHGALAVGYTAMVGLPAAYAATKLVARWIREPQPQESPGQTAQH